MNLLSAVRYEPILDLYAQWYTVEDIADITGLSVRSVCTYITTAKANGDSRVRRPLKSIREVRAYVRSKQIEALAMAGHRPNEIARKLGVHPSLVQKRMCRPIELEFA
jgi:DNA-binding CsgD family transcriptional regulator